MLAELASLALSLAQPAEQRTPEAIPCTRVIQPEAGKVHALALSGDGQRVLIGCESGRAFVFELASGALVEELKLGGGAVWDVAFDASSERFLTVQFDVAQVWSARTFEAQRSLRGQKLGMLRGSFSPDGTLVATGSAGNGAAPHEATEARVWRVDDGEAVATVGGMEFRVLPSFRPDGRALLVSSAGNSTALVRRLDGRTAIETRLAGHASGLACSAWSPDGTLVLTASSDFTARLWDASSGKTKHELKGHSGYLLQCAFSPDGKEVSTTSWVDRTTRIWSVKSGAERLVLSGHAERPTCAEFAPNGRAFASVDATGTGLVFDLRQGAAVGRLTGHTGIASGLAFTPDAKWLVTCAHDGTVRVWSNPLAK